jgi:tetratricopeptide (TPR) repeat protein
VPAAANPSNLVAEGYRLLDSGRGREAEAHFRSLLVNDPENLQAREGLVSVYEKLGEPDKAAREADVRLRLAPRDVAWRERWIWIVHEVPARREEAISAARAMADERPRELRARVVLAEVLSATEGRLAQAIAEYRKAVELAPADPVVRTKLGETLVSADRIEEAVAEYRKIVTLNPGYRQGRRGLAQTLSLTGQTDEARVMFDRLIAEDPRDAEALCGRAEIARWDGDYETASRLMHNALAAAPECAELRAEEHDVFRRAAQMRAARRGPILPLVLGLIGFCVLLGSLSRAITVRTYTALVVFTASLVGLALGWLYLVSSSAPRP